MKKKIMLLFFFKTNDFFKFQICYNAKMLEDRTSSEAFFWRLS